MKLVFIVLNYKTYKDTINQVKEILADGYSDYKIVVVDNKSPNESFDSISSAFFGHREVDVIQANSNGGFAIGNNLGLRYASRYNPEFVCIINNDVHFTKHTIETLESDFEITTDIGAIAPIQLLPSGEKALRGNLKLPSFWNNLLWYTPFHSRKRIVYLSNTAWPNLQRVDIVPGALIFMKYSIGKKVGFFDESTFLYGEEGFLAKRLNDIGYFCYIDVELSYIHEYSKTISENTTSFQREKLVLESRLLYLRRYGRYPYVETSIIKFIGLCYIKLKSFLK